MRDPGACVHSKWHQQQQGIGTHTHTHAHKYASTHPQDNAPPRTLAATVANSGKAAKRALSAEDAAALHEYLIMDFALQLLHSSLRRGALAGRSLATLGLLDPLLGLMVRNGGGRGRG